MSPVLSSWPHMSLETLGGTNISQGAKRGERKWWPQTQRSTRAPMRSRSTEVTMQGPHGKAVQLTAQPQGTHAEMPTCPCEFSAFSKSDDMAHFSHVLSFPLPHAPPSASHGRCSGLLCLVNTPSPGSPSRYPVSPGGF